MGTGDCASRAGSLPRAHCRSAAPAWSIRQREISISICRSQSVDSVEVMANPFAAEYGRFSTSITQIRTRGGTNDWDFSIGNLVPRFRAMLRGVRGFEPRASIRGPIRKDRFFLAQDFQFRYVNTPVKSLPDEPEVGMHEL